MKKSLFLFFFCLLFSFMAKAQQIKSFTEDPVKFIAEMSNFLDQDDKLDTKDAIKNLSFKKKSKEIMERFTLVWNVNKFSDKQKKDIYKISNMMLKKKLKAFPHFADYIESLISFANTGKSEKEFNAWQLSLERLMARSTSTRFIAYIDMSNSLFNNGEIYKSSTTVWKTDNKEYAIEFDSVPKVIFSNLKLTCLSNGDSSEIINTKGIYYPTDNTWYGQGGKVTWKRAGFGVDSVYAEVKKYKIEMKSNKFNVDSVLFYNKAYFSKPLLGELEEKVLASQTPERATYPKFESYDKRIQIENLFKNVDYDGGFTMNGAKFIGSGSKDKKAKITMYKDNKPFIILSSLSYIIRKDRLLSSNAAITIYLDKDSIYHPGLEIKFIDQKKELTLLRGEEGLARTPFFDSYHKMDIYCEAIYWKTNEPKIDFAMIKGGTGENEVLFESNDFYDLGRFDRMQGMDEIHPLQSLKDYSDKMKSKELNIKGYASYLKTSSDQVVAVLVKLASMGFITYDADNYKVILKDRLFHYLSSRSKRADYDVLQFRSVTNRQTNASLNLNNLDFKLAGVEEVFLSDSSNVYLYPSSQQVTLKKNRDFIFDGRVHAGLFDFYGNQFVFNYDLFKLDMPQVDSMTFQVHSKVQDERGNFPLVRVKNAVEKIIGELMIDKPNNKSGLKPYSEYPVFTSKKDSYVYYDKESIRSGVYSRDKFFFHVDPFTIDSLDNFKTEALALQGNFVSANIFPDFREDLKVQEDYSLGFKRKTPTDGFPVYGGKGKYNNMINLSADGLKGDGIINYLVSEAKSEAFIFYPDSMNADIQYFHILEQTKDGFDFPNVNALDAYLHWLPYQDFMKVSKKDKPLSLYNGQSKLNGSVELTPTTGLTGEGTMEFADAEMDSKVFKFKKQAFDADSSDFRLKTYDLSELAFSTHNYKGHIDFKERKGEFKSNGGGSKVDFPVNQYICFMDQFTWNMDQEEIELANTSKKEQNTEGMSTKEIADLDLSGSEFVSVHPDQDSLRFFSPRAKYNLRDNIIQAKDVKYIKVADAAIFPDKGNVTILKKAEMKTLENAKILANMATKYHEIYSAFVTITTRKHYNGSGTYDYVDEAKKTQQVYFDKVTVDTTFQSYAIGEIQEMKGFTLSPNYKYYGKVKMMANNPFLNFSGNCLIQHPCTNIDKQWFVFKADINPNEIYIPILKSLKGSKGEDLFAGFLKSKDSAYVYTAFIGKKQSYSDEEILSVDGFLYYAKDVKEYRISGMERIKENKLIGNYISLYSNCDIYTDGKYKFSSSLGSVKMVSYGNAFNNTKDNASKFDMVIGLDFFFSDKCMKMISESFEKDATAQAANTDRDTYYKGLVELLGLAAADKYKADLALGNTKKMPKELEHTFMLSEVHLEWNPETNSYISKGKIGINNIDKTQVFKMENCYVELQKKKSGDILNIYLENESKTWYFFTYVKGTMAAISSNADFNNTIKDLKPDNRTLKTEKGQEPYLFMGSTEKKKKDFLKKMGVGID